MSIALDFTTRSAGSWKKRLQEVDENEHRFDDKVYEESYSVMKLAYWKEKISSNDSIETVSEKLLDYDDTVR